MKEERFYHLVRRTLSGAATPDEAAELQQLIDTDERLALLYRQLFPGGEEERDEDSEALLAYSAHYARMQIAGLFDPVPEASNQRPRRIRLYGLSAAACLLAIVLTGAWWFGLRSHSLAGKEIKTQKGFRTHVVLADGTEVWLNGNSSITYKGDFNQSARELTLRGEAYFKVAKNADKPFIIQAGALQVKVLGTAFNIRSYADEPDIETTLESGAVEITLNDQPGNTIQLKPGQKLRVDNSLRSTYGNGNSGLEPAEPAAPILLLSKMKVDTAGNALADAAWREGKLVFDGDDFQRVASKIEKWYNVTVVAENKHLHSSTFTGVFDNKSLETVLGTLRETGKLDYRFARDTVYIR